MARMTKQLHITKFLFIKSSKRKRATSYRKERNYKSLPTESAKLKGNTTQPAITRFFPQPSPKKGMTLYQRARDYKWVRKELAKIKEDARLDAHQTRQGYLYTASNNYTEYKVSTLINRRAFQTQTVYLTGHEVANASVDEDWGLTHIEVDPVFQGQKIGSKLIRFINRCSAGQLTLFGGKEHNSRYTLTEEGAALANYCVKEKIITDKQLVDYVPPSPESSPRF